MENKGNNNMNGNNNGGNNNGGNNNGGNNRNGMTIMIFILAALVVLFLTSLLNSCAKDATNKEITYSEFINMVESDKVEEVTFTSNRIKIKPKSENKLYRISYYTAELNDETLLPLLKEHGVKFSGTVEDVSSAIMWNMVSYILPLVIVWILLYFFIFRKMGGGGVMGVGKTTAKVYVEKSTGVTFKDVAGQDEAKDSLQEVVDFLHNPKKYTDIGAKLPKGALLVGPPGTGKTLLAKAVAGEAKVPFFSLAGSDFVEMFVGVGASRVRDLFKEAQKQAPCIIFIDEIDAIGKSRDTRYGGNDEREQTLNQLLAEMDGFDTSKGLLILAATNRPEVLDKALLRPGRFDRRIIVDKPDLKGRVETLKVHAKNVLMDETVDLDAIALATSGAVGSDLANMINEAAINAVKAGRKYVNQGDLFESVEVVIAGKEKKDRIMSPKEKKMVAYHEVGHALVTALQKDTEPVQKITIVPRTMGTLGYTMQVPEEEKFLMTKNELAARLVTYMGGRAAEEIVFDSVTTGASNDIEQATKIARAMVTQYGMSEKFGLMGLVTVENQYLDGRASLNCGEDTAAQIDQEVMRILKASYDEAVRLLQENRGILDKISQYLYEHETITGKEFMKIFRELKGIAEKEEQSKTDKAAEKFRQEENDMPEFSQEEQNYEEYYRVKPRVKPQEERKESLKDVDRWREFPQEVNTLKEAEDFPQEVNTLKEAEEFPQEINTLEETDGFPLEVNTLEGAESFSQEVNTLKEAEGFPQEVNTLKETEGFPLEVNTLEGAEGLLRKVGVLEEMSALDSNVQQKAEESTQQGTKELLRNAMTGKEVDTLEGSEEFLARGNDQEEVNTLEGVEEFLLKGNVQGEVNTLESVEEFLLKGNDEEEVDTLKEAEGFPQEVNTLEGSEALQRKRNALEEANAWSGEGEALVKDNSLQAFNVSSEADEKDVVFLEAEEIAQHSIVREVIPEELTRKVFNREEKEILVEEVQEEPKISALEMFRKNARKTSVEEAEETEVQQASHEEPEEIIQETRQEETQEPEPEDGEDYLDKLLKGMK
ncbi:ATP-dependent zinc metalloprotease FtsH [Lachnospiraceae bacterium]|nr:ATP-dependent zinc metalloprotease FtsH [Lachnospiraceae bacterium]